MQGLRRGPSQGAVGMTMEAEGLVTKEGKVKALSFDQCSWHCEHGDTDRKRLCFPPATAPKPALCHLNSLSIDGALGRAWNSC